ncbi:MAG TPA: 4'-phosphopantetheinyl transferase superfamily protein [Thermotogota bacterium]|nr:4'-phosphopantetheinyl transferase superfamily protein [Thermotogota bacterium]
MIVGMGVDLLDLRRLSDALVLRMAQRILSNLEMEVLSQLASPTRKREFVGGRFCVKEAFFKACNGKISHIPFAQIQVDGTRGPLRLSFLPGEVPNPLEESDYVWVSLSHEKEMVMACVIIEKVAEKHANCREFP